MAVSAAQTPPVGEVIAARCREVGVPLLVEGRQIRVEAVRSDLGGHRLHLSIEGMGPRWALFDVELALAGLFQPANAALAVAAVRAFAGATGLDVPDTAVRAGCAGVRWPGRFQVLGGVGRPPRPIIFLDGAHNPIGAAALGASLRYYFPGASVTLVLGISADKDRAGILKALAPVATRLVLTAAANPRATPPAELAAELPPLEAEVVVAPDAAQALAVALGDPGTDVVCVAGSLFLVGDALRWLQDRGLGGDR